MSGIWRRRLVAIGLLQVRPFAFPLEANCGAPIVCRAARDRVLVRMGSGSHQISLDALPDQVIRHGIGPLFGQRAIVDTATTAVGVSIHEHPLHRGIRLDVHHNVVEKPTVSVRQTGAA